MNFFISKPILLLFCGLVSLCDFAYSRLHINDDGIVGVTQEELNDYIIKAIKGFQKVMLQGDDELKYPIMDPYEVEDVSFDLDDPSSHKKYRLNFINTNETIIKGLADYQLSNVQVSSNHLTLSLGFMFNDLQTKFGYKLEGYVLKNMFPLYGEGFIKLSTKDQGIRLKVILSIDHGYIVVENAYAFKYWNDIDIKVTGLMDLPGSFASAVLDDILEQWMSEHSQKVLNKYALEIVEQDIGGMTKEEFLDYLDHFVKKYDQQ